MNMHIHTNILHIYVHTHTKSIKTIIPYPKPQHSRGRGRQIPEFKASLVYKASSRTVRAVPGRNPISKNKTRTKNNNVYECLLACVCVPYVFIAHGGQCWISWSWRQC